ncbi:spectrin beta chain, non-erythrocytic 4 [Pelobates cultripes]|uniref:Spectrin beta chain, non-erythrocytic 4 n=1 Tax=Pelobates cultripes TaxID=61616 RepID=A0AAD1SXS6_PELCU|nr:spectrin beta chain, non-erythrocytic 4 [Pelobates cultripes]
MEVLVHFEEISGEWEALKRTLQGCEDSLTVASKLQQFIQDLDNFLTWLVKTQTAVATEELPSNLVEAERLLGLHGALKEEINRYEEDYNKIQAVSDLLSLEEADLPYLSLQQWLQKLEVGWNKLLQMWENRREVLVQSHIFHLFLRDVKQAEACLNNQESTLAHVELPNTVDSVEVAIKKHRDFLTTMELNAQKVITAVDAGESLIRLGNVFADRVQERISAIQKRSQRNMALAHKWLQRLKDHLELQCFLQDCNELDAWISEKTLMARDTSRDLAQRPHKKWLKHQAFMAELSQNKGWLEKIEKEGNQLIQEKPELAGVVKKKIEEIRQCWVELESSTQEKAQQLFHCNKADLVVQNYSDLGKRLHRLEEQLQPVEHVPDVSNVNTQLKKLEKPLLISRNRMDNVSLNEWKLQVGDIPSYQ